MQLSEDVAPPAAGRSRRGSPRGAGIASLPWNQPFVKGTDTPRKAQKGELEGGGIFTTSSLHHTTLVHTCVRFTCPGRHAEGQEHGLQREKRGRQNRAPRPRSRATRPTRPRPAGPAQGPSSRGAGGTGRPEARGKGPSRSLKTLLFPDKDNVKADFRPEEHGEGQSPSWDPAPWAVWATAQRPWKWETVNISHVADGDTRPVPTRPSEGPGPVTRTKLVPEQILGVSPKALGR